MSERGEGRGLVYSISVLCVLPARIRWLSQSCALEQFMGRACVFQPFPWLLQAVRHREGAGLHSQWQDWNVEPG